jgi:hypothetical protein
MIDTNSILQVIDLLIIITRGAEVLDTRQLRCLRYERNSGGANCSCIRVWQAFHRTEKKISSEVHHNTNRKYFRVKSVTCKPNQRTCGARTRRTLGHSDTRTQTRTLKHELGHSNENSNTYSNTRISIAKHYLFLQVLTTLWYY